MEELLQQDAVMGRGSNMGSNLAELEARVRVRDGGGNHGAGRP
jgi:hypothetical protein